MKSETRTYCLNILSPLHIGCGQVYEPTSFVIREAEKILVGFEPWHFLMSLSSDKRQEYSAICRKGTVESLLEIYKFINHEAGNMDGVEVALSSGFIAHHKSVLALPFNRFIRELNSFSIQRTAFTPLDMAPYIPGSAIKGALRTAVLNSRFIRSGSSLPVGKKPREENRSLQEKLLGGSFENDPFSRLKISDFYPVGPVKRRIVYGVNKKKKQRPDGKEASGVYQIFEIIEPGAVFAGTVTAVDSGAIQEPVTFQEVEAALPTFFGGEYLRELREMEAIDVTGTFSFPENTMPLRLGRHSGAESVTSVGDKRKIKIRTGRQSSKTLNHATTIWFASPDKKPKNNICLQPFGWAAFSRASTEDIAAGEAFRRREKERQDLLWQQRCQRQQEERQRRRAAVEARLQAEKEQQRLADDLAREPWRPWVKEVSTVSDWGGLQEKVTRFPQSVGLGRHPDADSLVQSPEKEEWRRRREVAEAIAAAARKVHMAYPKNWDDKRDSQVSEWLAETDIVWEPLAARQQAEQVVESEVVAAIRGFADFEAYQQNPPRIAELDLDAARLLRQRLKEWGCDQRKAKKNKQKIWKEINTAIRKLREKG